MGSGRGLRGRTTATRHGNVIALRVIAVAALTAVASLATAAPGVRADNTPQLNAKFNINLTFTMTTGDGAPLGSPSPPGRAIPAGYYAVNVDDTAQIGYMTFLLKGPGVEVRTTNDEGASAVLTFFVTFLPNSTYSFSDAVNPSLAPEYFSTSSTVLGSTTTSTTTSTSSGGAISNSGSPVGSQVKSKSSSSAKSASASSSAFRGTLDGTVTAAGKLSLTFNGKAVSSLKSGRYKVTVTDQSTKNGFTIQEAGRPATTVSNVTFVGRRSATLELATGQWLFYPTVVGRKSYFTVVR
jgi:hypothetical protein